MYKARCCVGKYELLQEVALAIVSLGELSAKWK